MSKSETSHRKLFPALENICHVDISRLPWVLPVVVRVLLIEILSPTRRRKSSFCFHFPFQRTKMAGQIKRDFHFDFSFFFFFLYLYIYSFISKQKQDCSTTQVLLTAMIFFSFHFFFFG